MARFFLLDTNHASKLISGDDRLRSRIEKEKRPEDIFAISITILGELYFSAYASQRSEENVRKLESFLNDIHVWDFDKEAAELFGRIQAGQKSKGRPIPPMDAQIIAVAQIHKAKILTADHHFNLVEGVKVENWLS
jgi:tRNA(fMet)-specific endonuclease VapC